MALFESYERREKQILAKLAEYGINSIEEAAEVTKAAGLDVLSSEPMAPDSPFMSVKDKNRLLITPHIAWAAVEARQRLMKIISGQIKDFFNL